jgi:hypothetical protein
VLSWRLSSDFSSAVRNFALDMSVASQLDEINI